MQQVHTESTLDTSVLRVFPEELKLLVFGELDLWTLIKSSQVNKEWYRLLQTDSLWKAILLHPQNQSILYHGRLWQVMFQYAFSHAKDTESNTHALISTYLSQVFKENVHATEEAARYIRGCFTDLLEGISERTRGQEDLSYCKEYVGFWTAEGIISTLHEYLAQLQQWVQADKLQEIQTKDAKSVQLNLAALGGEDYQQICFILLKLRQLEQLITTIVLLNKIKILSVEQNRASATYIVTRPEWASLLTAKGLLALYFHDSFFLNPKRSYEETFQSLATQKEVSAIDKLYFEWLIRWFSQADESTLLKAFTQLGEAKAPEIILKHPKFLARVSDRTFLQLALDTSFSDTKSLFKTPEFIQRLKQLPYANQILLGLTQGKVKFNHEELENKSDTESDMQLRSKQHRCEYFALGILVNAELTALLKDNEIIEITQPIDDSRELVNEFIVNPHLTKQIASNIQLLIHFAKKTRNSPLELAKKPEISKLITTYTSFQLALLNIESALAVLRDETLVLPLEPKHLEDIKRHYRYHDNYEINSLVQRRYLEWLASQKTALRNKPYEEVLQIALSDAYAAQPAAECLAERADYLQKLLPTQLDLLMTKYKEFPQIHSALTREYQVRKNQQQSAIRNVEVLVELEQQAFNYFTENQFKEYAHLKHDLCRVYALQGNFERATECYESEKKYEDKTQPLPETPMFALIESLWKLPQSYQHLRAKVANDFKEASQHQKDETAIAELITRSTKKTKNLLAEETRLTNQHKKIDQIMQKLRDHGQTLQQQAEEYLEKSNIEPDAEEKKKLEKLARVYVQRSTGVRALESDLQEKVDQYYKNDFSRYLPNDKSLYRSLSQVIEEHLETKNPGLKEHAGTKQKIFYVLTALAWLLAPHIMLMKTIATDSPILHAKNGTEKIIDNEIEAGFKNAIKAAPSA